MKSLIRIRICIKTMPIRNADWKCPKNRRL